MSGLSGAQSVTEAGGKIIITGRKAAWLRAFTDRNGGSLDDTLELLAAGALYAEGGECEPQEVTITIKAGTPLARIIAVNRALAPELPVADLMQGWIDSEAKGHCEQSENLMIPAKVAIYAYRNRLLREHMAEYMAKYDADQLAKKDKRRKRKAGKAHK